MASFSPLNSNNQLNSMLDNQFNSQINNMDNQNMLNTQQVEHFSPTPIAQNNVGMPTHVPSKPQQLTQLSQLMPQQTALTHTQPVHMNSRQPVGASAIGNPIKPASKLNIPGTEVIVDVLKDSTKKILTFIILSLSLIAALSWSEAIKSLVKKYITLGNDNEMDLIIYATVITVLTVVFIQILRLVGVNIKNIPIIGIIQ